MLNNEYNSFGENKRIDETKQFKEIQTNKIGKESSSPASEVYKTNEYGSASTRKLIKSNNSLTKKLLQNVSEATSSIVGGVTATAVAVATTVVMFSNVVLSTPTFELIDKILYY